MLNPIREITEIKDWLRALNGLRNLEDFDGGGNSIQREEYYARGSDLIQIPTARLNEIPEVIHERHKLESARLKLEEIWSKQG